jgi:hypothetical protein
VSGEWDRLMQILDERRIRILAARCGLKMADEPTPLAPLPDPEWTLLDEDGHPLPKEQP